MDWQFILVILIVAGAACYLGRQSWRTWRGKKSCCRGGCGCDRPADGSTTLIPTEQVTLRRRNPDT